MYKKLKLKPGDVKLNQLVNKNQEMVWQKKYLFLLKSFKKMIFI